MSTGAARLCAHCDLPLSRPSPPPAYCCVGCRLAAAVGGRGEDRERGLLEARLLVASVLAMGVMTFSLVLYGEDLHDVVADEQSLAAVRNLGRAMLALFALPVLALLGPPLLLGAVDDLRAGRVRMDGLIVLAVSAAYGLSLYSTWTASGDVYFETATMVLVLVTFGRRLEARARTQGRDAAAALAEVLPERVTLADDAGEREADPADVTAGDVLLVRPGETVPVDGVVLCGRGELQRAHLTGEHEACPVAPGDPVLAGSVNGHAALHVRADGPARQSRLARIKALLDEPLQTTRRTRLVDAWAGRLAVAAMLLALGAGVRAAQLGGAGDGLRVALSVLLVSCPCAFGLAMPLAYRSLRVALARRGLLVHDAAQLERAASVDHIVLDKTGTLTDTRGALAPVWSAGPDAADDLRTLVAHSGHALSAAVEGSVGPLPDDLRVIPGCGVEAHQHGRRWRAGRPGWLAEARWDPAARKAADAAARGTAVVFAVDDEVRAVARVDQRLRVGAVASVAALRQRASVEILSGDGPDATRAMAEPLGVDARSGLSPEDKRVVVDERRAAGATVLMAGDGINDAPALAGADVALAMGSGTATARAAAGIEVLRDDLEAVGELLLAARTLRRTVQGNLFWALAYNAVALALAASGSLHPLVAVAAMILSSLVVSLRSARLLQWSPPGAAHTSPSGPGALPARSTGSAHRAAAAPEGSP